MMKLKLLLMTVVLAVNVASSFGQAAIGMATGPLRVTETYAIVPDGNHSLELNWDVYLPSTPGQHPAVLVIFGGRFKEGDRSQVAAIAAELASRGFVALAIDYRLDEPNFVTGPCLLLPPFRINPAT